MKFSNYQNLSGKIMLNDNFLIVVSFENYENFESKNCLGLPRAKIKKI